MKVITTFFIVLFAASLNAQITETFEDELQNDNSFTVDGLTFTLTDNLMINNRTNFSCDGSEGQNNILDSGLELGSLTGVIGSIVAPEGYTFQVSANVPQCGWPGNNEGASPASGTIRFTGETIYNNYISEDFEIESTNGNDMVSIEFTEYKWQGIELKRLEIEIVEGMDYWAMDNLVFKSITPESDCPIGIASNEETFTTEDTSFSQSFTTICEGLLSEILIGTIFNFNTLTVPEFTLNIYEGNTISDTPFFTTVIPENTQANISNQFKFNIENGPLLNENTQYTFEMSIPFLITTDYTNPYPDGNAFFSNGDINPSLDYEFDIKLEEPDLSPTNDNICNAIPLTLNSPSTGGAYTNVDATTETNEQNGSCYFSNDNADNSVWFSFEAPASGEVQISTRFPDGTLTDSQLLLYDISDCSMPMYGAILACDEDDDAGVDLGGSPHFNAIIAYSGLTSGETYHISVDGYNGATGTFDIGVFADTTSFITTWQTNSDNESITIPTDFDETYSYEVDWGDGSITSDHTGNASHTYDNAGLYDVKITGHFPRIVFSNSSQNNSDKIIDVKQWGNNPWYSMRLAFVNCVNLEISATDAPDLSNVSDLSNMFAGAESFNQPLNNWDVSNVINMNNMFFNASSFNQPLDNWDVSNVTNFSYMFYSASNFNQPINDWNTSSALTLESMFSSAIAFNQPLDNWDVSSVTNMRTMFDYAPSFNQPINNWNVSNVTDMATMFANTYAFNQPLNQWNVSNVTNMYGMFFYAIQFNQPLDNWNVANVTDMSLMFNSARNFNQPLDSWDVSNVTDMSAMFNQAVSFNQPLNNWDVSNVTSMNLMFSNSSGVDSNFNQPLNNWDVSNVNDMGYMFYNAINFNQPLNNWNVSNVTDMPFMLSGTNLSVENYDAILQGWATLPNLQNDVLFGAQGLNYCNADAARDLLVSERNWTVTDAGADCATLSNGDELLLEVNLFPNPASDYIKISNLNTEENYIIYDALGKQVNSGELLMDSKITVSHLEKGIYFLKLDNYKTLRFVKN